MQDSTASSLWCLFEHFERTGSYKGNEIVYGQNRGYFLTKSRMMTILPDLKKETVCSDFMV